MILRLDTSMSESYISASQQARVLTESWVAKNMFCPNCGNEHIASMQNNSPVADFHCLSCRNEYELKSKNGKISTKITDGAYSTMIERITSNINPHFFLMEYEKETFSVKNFVIIPNIFFTPNIIEKRRPLALTARRAGWIGCNILIQQIPKQGIISIVNNGQIIPKDIVLERVDITKALITKDITTRGWLMDTLFYVNTIQNDEFTLSDIYKFECYFAEKHPANNNIQAKIRQQLQILRDKGFIKFIGRGKYRKN